MPSFALIVVLQCLHLYCITAHKTIFPSFVQIGNGFWYLLKLVLQLKSFTRYASAFGGVSPFIMQHVGHGSLVSYARCRLIDLKNCETILRFSKVIVDVRWEGEDFASQGHQNFVKIGEDLCLLLQPFSDSCSSVLTRGSGPFTS